jgi:asparagine synthase (glutamine-hydrolysing)
MCGIAGTLSKTPRPANTEDARKTIEHRGPDASGIYQDEHVSLIHTRLSIIDLSSGGAQPMKDEKTGVVIAYNGEIYNYRELRAQLRGETFLGQSDTEVILRLYLRYGTACAGMLRGMFAFAIWDPRSLVLHLCRDRFGIKPFFYLQDGDTFSFSSEIKGLLALGARVALNRQMVYDYLKYGRTAHTADTFFHPVRALEPGTVLSVRDGRIEKTKYWSLRAEPPEKEPREVEEALWALLQETVRLHLVSDVPVGISLSSGVDSQSIVRTLAQIGEGEFHTFTFGYDEPEYDEIIRVQKTRFSLPLTQHYLRVRPEDMLQDLRRAIRYFEVPLGGLGTLSAYRLMQVTREVGIKVLLSGEGADETFGGYRYYYYAYFRDLYESGQMEKLERELEAFTRTNGERLAIGSDEFRSQVLDDTAMVRAPDGTSLGGNEFTGPDLVEAVEKEAPSFRKGRQFDHLRRAMLRDLVELKIPKLLWFQDRASMAWGIETRVPFLDHKLVEFVYGLSKDWIIRDGISKYIFKKVMQHFGGVDYSQSVKHYVATPQREWLKGPLFGPINRFMDGGCLAQSRLIDYAGWKRAYADYAESPELGDSFFVWKMINLEALLREFFGGAAP